MIILPAQLDNYNNRKDKSASIRFITDELTTDQVLNIHKELDKYGYLVFKPDNVLTDKEKKDIDNLKSEFHGKSKSQRLMNVLFVYWEQHNTGYEKFEDFYNDRMEANIQKIKDQLN